MIKLTKGFFRPYAIYEINGRYFVRLPGGAFLDANKPHERWFLPEHVSKYCGFESPILAKNSADNYVSFEKIRRGRA